MAITDLINTTWVLNSNCDFLSLNLTAYTNYNIEGKTYFGGADSSAAFVERDFTTLYYNNNGSSASLELITSSSAPYWYNRYSDTGIIVGYYASSGSWSSSGKTSFLLKIITFTGGSDVNNPNLISWLESEGKQVEKVNTNQKSLYKRISGKWVKKNAYKRVSGKWVQISSTKTNNPYLTFSSSNSFTLSTYNKKKNWNGILEYSTDTSIWNIWDGKTSLSADSGKLYLRGSGNTKITGGTADYRWVLEGTDIACEGNIENLLDYAGVAIGEHPTMIASCYYRLFSGCTALISAPELPATTLSNLCYNYMFYGCTSLISAPELPATTLTQSCYAEMFNGCTSLTTTPELPATTLGNYCYSHMFDGCTNLVNAPALLPAMTLANSCYSYMFSNCTSLKNAPTLPATVLMGYCYSNMFYNCDSLESIPLLPATTLMEYCYSNMFRGSAKIKLSATQTGEYQTEYRIPTSGTGTTASSAVYSMFKSTGGTFTSDPVINTTYYTSNMVV